MRRSLEIAAVVAALVAVPLGALLVARSQPSPPGASASAVVARDLGSDQRS
jgi:hypothetical protein